MNVELKDKGHRIGPWMCKSIKENMGKAEIKAFHGERRGHAKTNTG